MDIHELTLTDYFDQWQKIACSKSNGILKNNLSENCPTFCFLEVIIFSHSKGGTFSEQINRLLPDIPAAELKTCQCQEFILLHHLNHSAAATATATASN